MASWGSPGACEAGSLVDYESGRALFGSSSPASVDAGDHRNHTQRMGPSSRPFLLASKSQNAAEAGFGRLGSRRVLGPGYHSIRHYVPSKRDGDSQ